MINFEPLATLLFIIGLKCQFIFVMANIYLKPLLDNNGL